MRNTVRKAVVVAFFCLLSVSFCRFEGQAKERNFEIYNGIGASDLQSYFSENTDYIKEDALYIPGDMGRISPKQYDYAGEITKIEFSSTDPNIISVDAEGRYQAKNSGYAVVYVTGWNKKGDIIFRGSHSFVVGGDVSRTRLSKEYIQAYSFGQDRDEDENDEMVIQLVNAPDLTYCSFELDRDSMKDVLDYRLDKEKKAIVVTLLEDGKTTLTFRVNGKEFHVTVCVTYVTINKSSALLTYKGKLALKIKQYSGSVRWVSTNKKVATVSKTGMVRARKRKGNTVIYAQIGDHRMGCAVSVVSPKMKKVVNCAKKIFKTCRYSQPMRMSRKYYDCSSLVWKSFRQAGKTLGNKNYAPVAADVAKWCVKKKKMIKGGVSEKNMKKMKLYPGDLVFLTGVKNGRYKGIYHVEMFVGYRCYGFDKGIPVLSPCWATRFDGYAYGEKMVGRP